MPKNMVVKLVYPLRRLLAELLKVPGFYFSEGLHPLELNESDIPSNYLHRELMDLGSASGTRFTELRRLFKPHSYLGIDKDENQVAVGKLKLLDMQQMDFIYDEMNGDLGVAFGTNVSPDIADKLSREFKNLVIGDYSYSKEKVDAETVAQKYRDKLQGMVDKILIRKRRVTSLSLGRGYEIYIFIKSHTSEGEKLTEREVT